MARCSKLHKVFHKMNLSEHRKKNNLTNVLLDHLFLLCGMIILGYRGLKYFKNSPLTNNYQDGHNLLIYF